MTLSEFIEITSEIEKFYDKDLTTEQSKIWFEELKNISKERYRQISKEIYRTSKFMPKLADIIEANNKLVIETKKQDNTVYECKKCNSTGMIIYKKEVEGRLYDYCARCDCANGQQVSRRIPTLQELGIVEGR